MHIQRAETRDFLEIAKLDRKAWAQNRNSEYIPDGRTRLAIVDRARAGIFVPGSAKNWSVLCWHFPRGRTGCIVCTKYLWIIPIAAKALVSALFDAILAACDQSGVDCFLTVDPENESAISLYEKWGFSERNFVKGYYRAAEDRYVLTRRCK